MQNVEIMTSNGSIEAAFEIARVFVYGERWRSNTAWCGECETYVPLVTVKTAASLDKTTCDAIIRRVEAGELHHPVQAAGKLLVCLCSLIDAGERREANLRKVAGKTRLRKRHFVWIKPETN